jgi:hypothetical protein
MTGLADLEAQHAFWLAEQAPPEDETHPFACGQCPATFPSEAAFRRHAEMQHGEQAHQRRPFTWRDPRWPGGFAFCFSVSQARELFASGSWGWNTDAGAKEGLYLLDSFGHIYRSPSDATSGHWETWIPAAAAPGGFRTRAVVVPGCADALQVHRLVRGLVFDAKRGRSSIPSADDDYHRWIADRQAAHEAAAAAPPDRPVVLRDASGTERGRTSESNAENMRATLERAYGPLEVRLAEEVM